jgi:hypothetical protein
MCQKPTRPYEVPRELSTRVGALGAASGSGRADQVHFKGTKTDPAVAEVRHQNGILSSESQRKALIPPWSWLERRGCSPRMIGNSEEGVEINYTRSKIPHRRVGPTAAPPMKIAIAVALTFEEFLASDWTHSGGREDRAKVLNAESTSGH